MQNEKNNTNENFLENFYQMCHSLGVIRQLKEEGYLSDDNSLSPKGALIVLKFQGLKTSTKFVDEYREKFSAKRLGKSGKMGDRASVAKKLERFKLQYPQFTEEVIMKATEDYIKANLHQPIYIMDADNFIFKIDRFKSEEKSRLAVFCEEVGMKEVIRPSNNSWE